MTNKCNCKEMSCIIGCDKQHTHKTFDCDVCNPLNMANKEELNKICIEYDEKFDPTNNCGYYEDGKFIRIGKHENVKNWWLSKIEQIRKSDMERVVEIITKEKEEYSGDVINSFDNILSTIKQENE